MSLYRLVEVLDPTGELGDLLGELLDNGALVEVDARPPDYEAAAKQWEAEFPCVCGPEYSDRGLIAPQCEHHYAEDGARLIVDAAVGGGLIVRDE